MSVFCAKKTIIILNLNSIVFLPALCFRKEFFRVTENIYELSRFIKKNRLLIGIVLYIIVLKEYWVLLLFFLFR